MFFINYIARHWRGELPLPVAFWVNGLLIYYFTSALLMFTALKLKLPPAISMLLLFCLTCWQLVGVIRAAKPRLISASSIINQISAMLAIALLIALDIAIFNDLLQIKFFTPQAQSYHHPTQPIDHSQTDKPALFLTSQGLDFPAA